MVHTKSKMNVSETEILHGRQHIGPWWQHIQGYEKSANCTKCQVPETTEHVAGCRMSMVLVSLDKQMMIFLNVISCIGCISRNRRHSDRTGMIWTSMSTSGGTQFDIVCNKMLLEFFIILKNTFFYLIRTQATFNPNEHMTVKHTSTLSFNTAVICLYFA